MNKVAYKVTIQKYWVEDGEIGRRWERTGAKNEKGEEVWDYTPSLIGPKEVSKTVYEQYVENDIDVSAIQRIANRKPKA